MQILINSTNALDAQELRIEALKTATREKLSRFADRISRVELHLSDVNADGGGVDKRCVLEVRPNGLEPVVTTNEAETVDKAIHAATRKMLGLLETTFGKLTSRHGH